MIIPAISMSIKATILHGIQNELPPQDVLVKIGVDISDLPPDTTDSDLWLYLLKIAAESDKIRNHQRQYIKSINIIMEIIQKSKKVVAVIGAGASVGPDFRSPGGLYDTIAKSGALSDPYKVFDLDYFVKDPSVFWRFAHLIYPSENPQHSASHYFLAELEKRDKLLRVYSQNVDTLEIGIPKEKLRCVHGSWRENKCMLCDEIHDIEDLRQCVKIQMIPKCKRCGGQIKPGIVFFGQRTNIEDEDIEFDLDNADLLIVIGTSLRVAPVSYIPEIMYNVPSILINREPVACQFNAELLGEGDAIINAIENELGWNRAENCKKAADFEFFQPNKFIMQNDNGTKTSFTETGRSLFLVNQSLTFSDQFE